MSWDEALGNIYFVNHDKISGENIWIKKVWGKLPHPPSCSNTADAFKSASLFTAKELTYCIVSLLIWRNIVIMNFVIHTEEFFLLRKTIKDVYYRRSLSGFTLWAFNQNSAWTMTGVQHSAINTPKLINYTGTIINYILV